MKNPIITNATRNAALPEQVEVGKTIVIQLAPEGEYPQVIDDTDADGNVTQREVVQILDRQAMDTLVANFEKAAKEAEAQGRKYGVLVDADHSSETSTNTAAMGWVTKLFVDPDKGLMAEIEPTSLGAEKINGKVYRFVSGAWTLDDANRPQELVSIGLTNKPNLPVAPMINAARKLTNAADIADDGSGARQSVTNDGQKQGQPADADGEPKGDKPDATGNADTPPAVNEAQKDKLKGLNMDIRVKLGLPAEATDEEVEQAIDALIAGCQGLEEVKNALGFEPTASNEETIEAVNAVINQCGDLQAKDEKAEKAKLNAEAEEFVAKNEDVIPEEVKEEVKEEYIEDPEKAQATVANFRKVHDRAILNAAKTVQKKDEPHKPVINWREAKKPVALNFEGALASCNGDPEKENELIRQQFAKH